VNASVPPPVTVTPVVTGQSPIFTQRHNRRGKPIGRPVLTGFELDFNVAMDAATTGNSGNYVVDAIVLKRVRGKRVKVLQQVGFSLSMVSSTAMRLLTGGQKLSKGGRIILNLAPPSGINGSGVQLDPNFATFTILTNDSGIMRP
jgi:hypothetical protein